MFPLQSEESRERRLRLKLSILMFIFLGFVCIGFIGFVIISSNSRTRRTNNEAQPHHTNHTTPQQQNEPKGRPLTFNFRNSMYLYDLSRGIFTCSTEIRRRQYTGDCPVPIQKWNKLIKPILQNQFLENKELTDVSYFSQITFTENQVIYKIREKYGLRGGAIYISRKVDWERKVPFGLRNKAIKVVKTDPEIDYSPCFLDKTTMVILECQFMEPNQSCRYEYNSCKISQPVVKDMTNLVNVLFGLKYFTLTWTTGEGLNNKTTLTEYLIEGELNDDTTPKDFYDRIELFDKEQKDWCDCVEERIASRRGIYSELQRDQDWDLCFRSIRPEFKAVIDYKMCPVELERRILFKSKLKTP